MDILLQTRLVPTITLTFDASPLRQPAMPPAQWTGEASTIELANKIDGLYEATISNMTVLGSRTLMITSSGNLGSTSAGVIAKVDESKLTDILLRIKIRGT
jgi:hypothetical protein